VKLFYLPGACSLTSHILLNEAGVDFEIVRVDTETFLTNDGEDYEKVNPLGYVPALLTDDVGLLLENGAILPYLADRFSFAGSASRYKLLEEIAYLSTELHKAFSPFFAKPDISGDARYAAERHLHTRLKRYDEAYAADEFDAAKVYAFVITNWATFAKVTIEDYPAINSMRAKIQARPAVGTALAAEGLA
jgi:glutathione S-transferase